MGLILLATITTVLVIGLFIFIFIYFERRGKKYTITTRRVTARQGILTKVVNEVGISHIRSINVNQSLWGRLWNYGNILIGTAGTEGVEVTIQGIENPFNIKELIAEQMNEVQPFRSD